MYTDRCVTYLHTGLAVRVNSRRKGASIEHASAASSYGHGGVEERHSV